MPVPAGFVIGDRGLGAAGDTHPAWMLAHAVAGPYLVVGASAAGQIHLARGLPRDDAFVVRAVGPWLAASVADGVGTRPLSRYGATYAVESLTLLLLRALAPPLKAAGESPEGAAPPEPAAVLAPPAIAETAETDEREAIHRSISIAWSQPAAAVSWPARDASELDGVMRQAFEKTHLGLRQHAQSLDLDLADLSCTALALLLNVETGAAVVGQVGDGALLGLTRRGQVLELVRAPDTGDPQATYTLNRANFAEYLAVQAVARTTADPCIAYFAMTDGLSSDLLYTPQAEALSDWAQKVDRNLRLATATTQAAAGMLNWLATYQVKGSWDDRTLVVITQRRRDDGDGYPLAGQPGIAKPTHNR